MVREKVVRSFVMSAIANDYEEIGMIVHDVGNWAAESGLSIDSKEIWDALIRLIEDGLAKAYRLGNAAVEIQNMSELSMDSDHYYYLTAEGIAEVVREMDPSGDQ